MRARATCTLCCGIPRQLLGFASLSVLLFICIFPFLYLFFIPPFCHFIAPLLNISNCSCFAVWFTFLQHAPIGSMSVHPSSISLSLFFSLSALPLRISCILSIIIIFLELATWQFPVYNPLNVAFLSWDSQRSFKFPFSLPFARFNEHFK